MLHVTDSDKPIALLETRILGSDSAPAQLMRYQHGNHLGSAVLELDDESNIISYEEYFPFGSTSYQAVASQTDLPKRYRYTGKERDTENDLNYHSARYCAPWLGRWISCDPAGLADGPNTYGYARDNPVRLRDPSGHQGESWQPSGLCHPAYSPCPEPTTGDSDSFAQATKARLAKQTPQLSLGTATGGGTPEDQGPFLLAVADLRSGRPRR